MKNLLIAFFLISFSARAEFCQYEGSYLTTGWKIHDPSTFDDHAKMVKNLIKTGLDDKSVVFDLSGPILTKNNDGEDVLLDAMMFDNLKTDRDEMFGDYAFLEITNDARDLVEVRWYDGIQRNIVINPKFLNCMSESAPYADNSVL